MGSKIYFKKRKEKKQKKKKEENAVCSCLKKKICRLPSILKLCIEGLWLPLEKTYFPLFLQKQNPETKAASCVKREDDKLILFYATVIVAML